jgi:hypothetical protein
VDEGIETLADARALLGDLNPAKPWNPDWPESPAAPRAYVPATYECIAGDNEHVKPDRHILGWLAGILQHQVTVAEARALLAETAKELDLTPGQ